MPKAAALVGELRVHGGVVQVHGGALRVALGELVEPVHQRQGHPRSAPLGDVAHAPVGGSLERVQALLRRALVVKVHHLELGLVGPGLGIDLRHHLAQLVERALAGERKRTGQQVDEADLHRLGRAGVRGHHQRCGACADLKPFPGNQIHVCLRGVGEWERKESRKPSTRGCVTRRRTPRHGVAAARFSGPCRCRPAAGFRQTALRRAATTWQHALRGSPGSAPCRATGRACAR